MAAGGVAAGEGDVLSTVLFEPFFHTYTDNTKLFLPVY